MADEPKDQGGFGRFRRDVMQKIMARTPVTSMLMGALLESRARTTCDHGVDTSTAICCRCMNPAFDAAAPAPPANVTAIADFKQRRHERAVEAFTNTPHSEQCWGCPCGSGSMLLIRDGSVRCVACDRVQPAHWEPEPGVNL